MRLLDLSIQNIGPFDEARLEFLSAHDDPVSVAIITGENGTGKTILLDAIRGLFGEYYGRLERAIWRNGTPFQIQATLLIEGHRERLLSNQKKHLEGTLEFSQLNKKVTSIPIDVEAGNPCPNWVVDFWRSALPADAYTISQLARPAPKSFLRDALKGVQRNAAVTELICAFDYLRGSDDPRDRRDGEVLYETIRRIVELSVLDGELSHVDRRAFMPMVRQSGQLVPLSNLSSGNAYLIQHMIGLLGKMYAVHVLRETDASELCKTPGLLLIDEAENHLHPRWQKRFLGDVLSIFPNLQIIATTHSPFIVGSVPGARVFVCRYDRERKTCVVDDATDLYANKPVEEILLSPAFDGTQPFGEEISRLLEERKTAFEAGDSVRRKEIEKQLKDKNPEYFSYIDIEERLQSLRGEGE
ncbi:AAA family ATPase [Sorangium sp. So ce542]|uniref:AAA family ATPase n=1 Tax=Sorangium sp. So ce542 TaxID=3133316 RepID=UPI003F62EE7C